jgi:GNAT superfamily N-acetyltransferase
MEKHGIIQIEQANSPEHFNQVRNLIRAFVNWHRQRHSDDIELIDEYFDPNAFEEELSTLPGKYSLPEGRLLLALYDGEPAGCIALRKIDTEACEMKRMFVYSHFQGKGIGHALAETLIREAKKTGYTSMKLDTSFRQEEALKLYQKMGFRRTNAYYQLPEKLKDWLVFMELKLE